MPSNAPVGSLEQRADELSRLFVETLFPEFYADKPDKFVPHVYARLARIAIEAIEEGLV